MTMNLGRELVACALREGTLRPFIEAGITREWLTDQEDPSRALIFPGEDAHAWLTLDRHWEQHSKVPSVDMFQRSHPAEAYRLPDTEYTADELIGLFRDDRRRTLTQAAASDIADLTIAEDWDGALELMVKAARIIRDNYASQSIDVDWDSGEYDFEGRIAREVRRGIKTGVPGLDSQFTGFQPGNLICYLGRAKAGKTSFALLSAISAWLTGKRVLFVSFEIAAGRTPDEPGIADRLDCFGAGISLTRYMEGALTKTEQAELREFRATCGDSAFRIVQPTTRYTAADLEYAIERFSPDVVYIDGFYFMTDDVTGKTGANWEGHDNLAHSLKQVAMSRMLPVIITHQVREKQLQGKKGKGIDDGAMMGGTSIIMFSDLVLGFDVDDDKLRTISCTRSRLNYLDTVYGTWDWSDSTFDEQAAPSAADESLYGYGKGDDE